MDLAKKGRQDAEKSGIVNIHDELNCLMAIFYALMNRENSYIITADLDYVEIFYKAQWFLDTHYRAWLVAKMIKEGRYGDPDLEFTDTEGYFEGALTLHCRVTSHLLEVLPPDFRPVQVGIVYVAPDGLLYHSSFAFEVRMLEMLKTRGATDGRCTDLFGDANIHVDLGPFKLKLKGHYMGIGKDVTQAFRTNDFYSSLSMLDLEHSLNCFERHAWIER